VDHQGQPGNVEPALVKAGFQLERPGQLLDRVVVTERGFHVIRLIGRKPARTRPLEKVQEEIRERIRRQEIAQRKKTFIADLRDRATVVLQKEQLAALADAGTGTAQPDARPPGLPTGGTVPPMKIR
jgi:peptidyl-prolyl cis-trans isomerase C